MPNPNNASPFRTITTWFPELYACQQDVPFPLHAVPEIGDPLRTVYCLGVRYRLPPRLYNPSLTAKEAIAQDIALQFLSFGLDPYTLRNCPMVRFVCRYEEWFMELIYSTGEVFKDSVDKQISLFGTPLHRISIGTGTRKPVHRIELRTRLPQGITVVEAVERLQDVLRDVVDVLQIFSEHTEFVIPGVVHSDPTWTGRLTAVVSAWGERMFEHDCKESLPGWVTIRGIDYYLHYDFRLDLCRLCKNNAVNRHVLRDCPVQQSLTVGESPPTQVSGHED